MILETSPFHLSTRAGELAESSLTSMLELFLVLELAWLSMIHTDISAIEAAAAPRLARADASDSEISKFNKIN